MLSDILLIILVVYVMYIPVFIIEVVKFGAKLASKPEEAAEIPVLNIIFPKKKEEKKKEQKAANQALEDTIAMLENIDAYDGTSMGQKEIKHGSK